MAIKTLCRCLSVADASFDRVDRRLVACHAEMLHGGRLTYAADAASWHLAAGPNQSGRLYCVRDL
jgi:hypothetical protein